MTPEEIIEFWFSDEVRPQWFSATPELDAEIRDKYEQTWKQAAKGKLEKWLDSPEGCLALCIVLDQFPLNMYRGQAKGFATEQKAVETVRHAIQHGFDKQLEPERVAFLLIPLMHSENIALQNRSVELFEYHGLESNLRFARHHRDIVKRFGRFPHRNEILGRQSTPEELEYLESKEAFKG